MIILILLMGRAFIGCGWYCSLLGYNGSEQNWLVFPLLLFEFRTGPFPDSFDKKKYKFYTFDFNNFGISFWQVNYEFQCSLNQRLLLILTKIISSEHGGFVAKKKLIRGFIIAHETLHSIHSKQCPIMRTILDMGNNKINCSGPFV